MKRTNASFKKRLSGFSLTELLIAIMILGILVTIAVVHYNKVVEKSRASEAEVVFENARAGSTALFFENGTLGGLDTSFMTDGEWHKIGMDNPNARDSGYFAYVLVGAADLYAYRRIDRVAYSDSFDPAKWLYMDLSTGRVFKSDYYQ